MNGLVDQATLAKLEAWSGTLYETPTATPLLKTVEYGLDYLHSGDNGAAVFSVRGFLKNQGYNCESVGSYDSTIISLVKQFQTKKGLTATGNVDQITLAMLEDATADTAWLSGSTVNLTAGKLAKAGFIEILLRPDVVAKINAACNTYGINEKNKVLHFLSQCMQETVRGQQLMENGGCPGDTSKYAGYYGAGILQLTGIQNYTTYKVYKNDSKILEPAEYAAQYVALNYPADSAGHYWSQRVERNVSWEESDQTLSEKITKCIQGANAEQDSITARYDYYRQIKAAIG